MMKNISVAIAITVILLFCPSLASAQAQTGSITGTVSDQSEGRLPGTTITLSGAGILSAQTIVSSVSGEYRFPALPPGQYTLTFELQGFNPVERSGVLVSLGGATRIDVVLQPAALAETVVVSGTSPTVDVETSRVGTNFTPQTLQAVPFERDLYDVLKSTPGVVNDNVTYRATSSINGAGPRNTGYAMDGIAMTDPAAAYTGVRHLNFDTVDEVEVMTGVNLPMLIKIASLRTSQDLLAVARAMRDHGRNAIWVASDLLRGEKANA